MAPLRDAVRFVHRQHRQIPVRQMLKEVVKHQPFRGDIQQTNLPAAAAGHHVLLLFAALRRVQTGRRHAVGQQLIDLIFHQRDQRRDHDRQAAHDQRRYLITQRLAATGRHNHQAVTALERRLDNRLLARTELLVAEGLL